MAKKEVEFQYHIRPELNEKIAPETRELLNTMAAKAHKDTCYKALIQDFFDHPGYKGIIKMGAIAIPLLLEKMATNPHHYFTALTELTDIDPCVKGETFKQAVNRWLVWGYEEKYLDREPLCHPGQKIRDP